MLLACLQREHEAAAAVEVLGGAGDAAGHAAQVLLAGGEQAERRAPEVEPVAERLTLADGHVHAALAGGRQHPERDRVHLGDDHRPVPRRASRPRLSAAASSTAPRKFGWAKIAALVSASIAAAHASASVTPSRVGTSRTCMP